jgi:hypothetical protein
MLAEHRLRETLTELRSPVGCAQLPDDPYRARLEGRLVGLMAVLLDDVRPGPYGAH